MGRRDRAVEICVQSCGIMKVMELKGLENCAMVIRTRKKKTVQYKFAKMERQFENKLGLWKLVCVAVDDEGNVVEGLQKLWCGHQNTTEW